MILLHNNLLQIAQHHVPIDVAKANVVVCWIQKNMKVFDISSSSSSFFFWKTTNQTKQNKTNRALMIPIVCGLFSVRNASLAAPELLFATAKRFACATFELAKTCTATSTDRRWVVIRKFRRTTERASAVTVATIGLLSSTMAKFGNANSRFDSSIATHNSTLKQILAIDLGKIELLLILFYFYFILSLFFKLKKIFFFFFKKKQSNSRSTRNLWSTWKNRQWKLGR